MRAVTPPRNPATQSLSILLVEDHDADALLVESMLRDAPGGGFAVSRATRVSEALEVLGAYAVDAVLLDLSLPDAVGLTGLEQLHERAPRVPIVVMTGLRDEDLDAESIQHGAQGYLVKGEVGASMVARTLRQAIERARMIEELKAAREAARHLATHDPLTGIANRLLLDDRVRHAVAHARRTDSSLAVLVLDLDRFKAINDTFGHSTGDEVLRCVAQRLSKQVRQSDTIARMGGDEFALVLTNLQRDTDAARVAQKLLDALARPITIGAERFQTGASVGIASFPRDGESAEALLVSADLAMYHAKRGDGPRYRFHSPEMNERAVERLRVEGRLATALVRQELCLYFQPLVDLRVGRIVGAEALVRWRDPEGGLRRPEAFLPVAEETGQIVDIGAWVLREACAHARRWAAVAPPGFRIAVNVSARQMRQVGFDGLVDRVLGESGLAAPQLTLELAETSLADDSGATARTLAALRDHGVRIAIDDFGQGRTALAHLKRVPFDEIKIDRAFVAGIPGDPTDVTIATAIITLAQGLGCRLVAEGVETAEQLAFLEEAGCSCMQGFLFSEPVPPEAFDALLARGLPELTPKPRP
jgi:diguanylate cyclase (GGDEF)-like protein